MIDLNIPRAPEVARESEPFVHHVLAIGLNVNDQEPPEQETRTLAAVQQAFGQILAAHQFTSEYEGKPERCFQFRICSPTSQVGAILPGLVRFLGQQCIAWHTTGDADRGWYLVYGDGRSEIGGDLSEYPLHV